MWGGHAGREVIKETGIKSIQVGIDPEKKRTREKTCLKENEQFSGRSGLVPNLWVLGSHKSRKMSDGLQSVKIRNQHQRKLKTNFPGEAGRQKGEPR